MERAFEEALEESVQGNSTALGVVGGAGKGTHSGTCHASRLRGACAIRDLGQGGDGCIELTKGLPESGRCRQCLRAWPSVRCKC